ncbi:hypothetical protein ACE1TF_10900 [Geomicrobium sp. JSM 1781026]|uniref:hypothetical protein n=1 Tax=Geomicrobium sp. JSM 1781026 TaxID=3344580 RepID=UPI0035C25483
MGNRFYFATILVFALTACGENERSPVTEEEQKDGDDIDVMFDEGLVDVEPIDSDSTERIQFVETEDYLKSIDGTELTLTDEEDIREVVKIINDVRNEQPGSSVEQLEPEYRMRIGGEIFHLWASSNTLMEGDQFAYTLSDEQWEAMSEIFEID